MGNLDEIVSSQKLLKQLGNLCSGGGLNEREVVTLSAEKGFSSELGYGGSFPRRNSCSGGGGRS